MLPRIKTIDKTYTYTHIETFGNKAIKTDEHIHIRLENKTLWDFMLDDNYCSCEPFAEVISYIEEDMRIYNSKYEMNMNSYDECRIWHENYIKYKNNEYVDPELIKKFVEYYDEYENYIDVPEEPFKIYNLHKFTKNCFLLAESNKGSYCEHSALFYDAVCNKIHGVDGAEFRYLRFNVVKDLDTIEEKWKLYTTFMDDSSNKKDEQFPYGFLESLIQPRDANGREITDYAENHYLEDLTLGIDNLSKQYNLLKRYSMILYRTNAKGGTLKQRRLKKNKK